MHAMKLIILLGALAVGLANSTFAQTDPLPGIIAQFNSSDVSTRESGFSALLSLGATLLPAPVTGGSSVKHEIAALLVHYPNDVESLSTALIHLLATENAISTQPLDPIAAQSVDELETPYGEYVANLVVAVVSLNDVNSLPSLLPLLTSGNMVINTVVSFGSGALDPVLAQLYSPGAPVRDGATFALLKMLSSPYNLKFKDATSISKIRAGLQLSASLAGDAFMQAQAQSGLSQLGAVVKGDLNGDGAVNCADLAIIRASFGKRVGQAGFDIRADLNGDGVVNILDLSTEARLMPSGVLCN
jgi:hypothetical protein